jgi:hypothetical protein
MDLFMEDSTDGSMDAFINIPGIDFSPGMPDLFVASAEMDSEWDMSFMYSF